MLELEISPSQTSRVWRKAIDGIASSEGSELSFQLSTLGNSVPINQPEITVEWVANLGPVRAYGLLGFVLELDDSRKNLEVVLNTSGEDGSIYLEGFVEDARIGLPSEYVEGIANEIKSFFENGPTPRGRLILKGGAHSPLGSSEMMFRNISRVALELMFSQEGEQGVENYFKLKW